MKVRRVTAFLLRDWKLKILSLLLAFILWFATTYIGETKMNISTPLHLLNLDENLIVKGVDTKHVMVTLDGALSTLKSIKGEEITVAIDLARAKEGRQSYVIRKSDIVAPKGARVEAVRPDYVVLELDKMVEKSLPVVVRLDEKLAQKYKVISWSPRFVSVKGSEESLAQRVSLRTVPVDGPFHGEEETAEVALDTRGLSIRKIRPETIRVTVRRIGK